jgi:hypothetical protein
VPLELDDLGLDDARHVLVLDQAALAHDAVDLLPQRGLRANGGAQEVADDEGPEGVAVLEAGLVRPFAAALRATSSYPL